MQTPSGYKFITNRIPLVLMNIYFCKVSAEKQPKMTHMLDLYRKKTKSIIKEQSRRLRKVAPQS
jgi:hypothetical protein